MRLYSLENHPPCKGILVLADAANLIEGTFELILASCLTSRIFNNVFGLNAYTGLAILCFGTPALFFKGISVAIGLKVHNHLVEVREEIDARNKPAVAAICYRADQATGSTIQGFLLNRSIDGRLILGDAQRLLQKLACLTAVIAFSIFAFTNSATNAETYVLMGCALIAVISTSFCIPLKSERKVETILSEMAVNREGVRLLASRQGVAEESL